MDVDEKLCNGVEESDDSSEECTAEGGMEVTCLFCNIKSATVEQSIDHCSNDHGFDIYKIRDKFKLDYYSYIRLINCIRSRQPDPFELVNSWDEEKWSDEEYLKPFDINDPWLWHDLKGLGITMDNEKPPNYVNSESGNVTMAQEHFSELLATIQNLTDEVKRKDEQIQKFRSILGEQIRFCERTVSDKRESEDASYFNSYFNAHIHYEMLSDQVRTMAFKNAIMNNRKNFLFKKVLDIGCGTGILSMFAVSAGADKVVAVDNAEILYHAMDIARENDFHDKVIFIKGRIEDALVPFHKFDVIISEWMGYFLLFESMLDSVIYARDKLLATGGIMLPSECNMYIIGASDPERHNCTVKFWENVNGYKMTTMINLSLQEANIDFMNENYLSTTSYRIHTINVNSCSVHDTLFTSHFTLIGLRDSKVTHIVGYFDAIFSLPFQVMFTTSPTAPATHWKQTIFCLPEPIHLKDGGLLKGVVTCSRVEEDVRAIRIMIEIAGTKSCYYIA